ncbi:MAG TPA: hypothetical protein VFB21_14200 [Chthonomonadaceae bacterium]|nr:hypothetical protein [Chthonomonadaceae bacterium]
MRLNRFREAFKENWNLVGLSTAVALSAATLNPLPLLAGLVAEATYMLFVPDSKWYEARLARRFDAEVEQRRQKLKEQTLLLLRPEMRERFARLEDLRRQIDTQSQDDKAWFREVLRKLDYLLEKFLVFASKEAQFRSYLQSLRDEVRGVRRDDRPASQDWNERAPNGRRAERDHDVIKRRLISQEEDEKARPLPVDSSDRWTQQTVSEIQSYYAKERERLLQTTEAEQDYDTKAVLEKRADVLQRRHEFAGKIGTILINLNHQLQLVEDTFGLINDEIRARAPEQVLADIEEVVVATDTMSTALEELAPYEQMVARAAGG